MLLMLCIAISETLQAQYWMQKGGGPTIDEAYDVAVDQSGNSYSTGYFSQSATFGSTTLSSNGVTDIFILKTDNQGNILWAKNAGGPLADRGHSIAVDALGNCYVTGYFSQTATFGNQSITSNGAQDIFIAKYDGGGNLIWVVGAGGTAVDVSNAITLDHEDKPIITGEFRDSVIFGNDSLGALGFQSDIFISKLDTAGNFVWTQQGAGIQTDRGIDVSADDFGNIYATGQFSQNILFDNFHPNSMFNISYLMKLDEDGNEIWFRIINGSNSGIINGLKTRGNGECYLTGDFTGNLTLNGNSPLSLSSTYSNRYFIAKYDSSGSILWGTAHGSDSDVSAQDVGFDDEGNGFITGYFSCNLDEYSSVYGPGVFKAVARSDIFMSAFDTNGTWLYSKQIGSQHANFAYGLDVFDTGLVHIAGSFRDTLSIPTTPNFVNLNNWIDNSCNGNNGYCGDPNYGSYHSLASNGNSDAFVANCFDPNREPYDFYDRSGLSGCQRDVIAPCFNANCLDTTVFCLNTPAVNRKQCINVGQHFDFVWNGLFYYDTNRIQQSPVHGQNIVEIDQNNECTPIIYDTIIYLDRVPPVITNEGGVPIVNSVIVCGPDTVTVTGHPLSNNYFWTSSLNSTPIVDSVLNVTQSGLYKFTYIDQYGCEHANTIPIDIQGPLPPYKLKVKIPDTVNACAGEEFVLWLYDSVSNPMANASCFNLSQYSVYTYAYSFTPTPNFLLETCEYKFIVAPDTSGIYTFTASLVRQNHCDTDTHHVTKSFYVNLLPSVTTPNFTLNLSGSPFFCPGDSATKIISGSYSYSWDGPGLSSTFGDTVKIGESGLHSVSSSQTNANQYGCSKTKTSLIEFCIAEKPQPKLRASSNVLCPMDSVLLMADDTVFVPPCNVLGNAPLVPFIPGNHYTWFGPSGQLTGNGPNIWVHDPGSYYCIYNDSDSCALISNTIVINQFTTPSLNITGQPVLCDGDSLEVEVIADTASVIEWQPPLSGSEPKQTIYQPGTYICKITTCNIEVYDTLIVRPSDASAVIRASRELCLDDSIVLYGPAGMGFYLWGPNGEMNDSLVISEPGIYSLTTTDQYGCLGGPDSIEISIEQVPTEVEIKGMHPFCSGDTIELEATEFLTEYLWMPTGETTRSIQVTLPGNYSVQTIDTNNCPDEFGPVNLDTLSTHAPVLINGSTSFCEGDFVTLSSARSQGLVQAYWRPENDSGLNLSLQQTGIFQLITTDTSGCVAKSDSISVFVQPDTVSPPSVTDTTICSGTEATLRAGNSTGDIYWMPNGDSTLLEISRFVETGKLEDPIQYTVWRVDNLCSSDPITVTVKIEDCISIEIPNVFSPNGDGMNDLFRTNLNNNSCFNCQIFNRWGMLVYEMNGFNPGWDGTVLNTGNEAPEGTYFYIVEYCRFDDEVIEHRGAVTLLRD